jgi:hypothetical protein
VLPFGKKFDRSFSHFDLIDESSREGLAAFVDTSLSGIRADRVLDRTWGLQCARLSWRLY